MAGATKVNVKAAFCTASHDVTRRVATAGFDDDYDSKQALTAITELSAAPAKAPLPLPT